MGTDICRCSEGCIPVVGISGPPEQVSFDLFIIYFFHSVILIWIKNCDKEE